MNALCTGLFGWLWGGFIQHEGGHLSLSRDPFINYVARFAIVPWTSPSAWFVKHSVKHHQFTNTKMDEDFQTVEGGPIRHHKAVEWNFMQRLQVLTVTLYGPVVQFFYDMGWVSYLQVAIIGGSYYVHGSLLLAFLPFFTFGSAFLFITQLNHIQECCTSQELLEYPKDFVKHQVAACVDYSHGNVFMSAISIFLNFQTYHHLFPSVSHFYFLTHKPLLDRTLASQGILVNEKGFGEVVSGYYSYLINLGSPHHH
jgi:linoleoyl-CoA desaturase